MKQSSQRLHTSVKLLTAKDSSSSSDPSNVDSDKKQVEPEQQADETLSSSAANEKLNTLLHKLTQVKI